MRELALLRYSEFDRELGPVLTRFVFEDDLAASGTRTFCPGPAALDGDTEVSRLVETLAPDYGPALSKHPALEDVTSCVRRSPVIW